MADRVTIIDVAARAGVAISSASSALNNRPGVSEPTRLRVLSAANELGYVPSLRAKSLSSKRAFAVGLVVHRDPDVLESDPFFGGFLGGMESVLDSNGYALVLQMGEGPEETLDRYRRLAADRRVDGVFLSDLKVDDPRIELLKGLHLPAVGINADTPDFPFPAVRQDHRQAIFELVDYLLDQGHQTIAHVTGPRQFIHARQRQDAWREALIAAGAVVGPTVEGDFTFEGGRRAARELLGRADSPTAVFCGNDLTAVGFMSEAREMGIRIPEDVSVAGYDGIEMGSYFQPMLTTLRTSPRHLGAQSARMLVDVVTGGTVEDATIEPAQLIVRGSTSTAPTS